MQRILFDFQRYDQLIGQKHLVFLSQLMKIKQEICKKRQYQTQKTPSIIDLSLQNLTAMQCKSDIFWMEESGVRILKNISFYVIKLIIITFFFLKTKKKNQKLKTTIITLAISR